MILAHIICGLLSFKCSDEDLAKHQIFHVINLLIADSYHLCGLL